MPFFHFQNTVQEDSGAKNDKNLCKFGNCSKSFDKLVDLIHHINNDHENRQIGDISPKNPKNRQIENDSSDLKIIGAFSLKNDDKENQNPRKSTKNLLKIKSFASIKEPQENVINKELLKFR